MDKYREVAAIVKQQLSKHHPAMSWGDRQRYIYLFQYYLLEQDRTAAEAEQLTNIEMGLHPSNKEWDMPSIWWPFVLFIALIIGGLSC